MKKLLIFLIVVFLLFVAALVAIPYLVKPKIMEATKKTLNEQLNAEADFTDITFSWVRHFPNLEMNVEDIKLVGKTPFEGIPLANIEKAKLVVHWRALLDQNNPEIKKIKLDKPQFYLQVLENGRANWDILKDDGTSDTNEEETKSKVKLSIEEYEIKEGALVYDDNALKTYIMLSGVEHIGTGNFTMDTFALDTKTKVKSMQVKYGGVTYLDEVDAEADAVVHVDMNDMVFTLHENQMRFNQLHALLEGSVAMPGEGILFNLDLSSPDTELKHLVSLLPNVYSKDFEDVKAEGTMAMSGAVKGLQNGEQYPGFNFDLTFKDGLFKYPGKSEQLERIMGEIHIKHPEGVLDSAEFDISKFEFYILDQPFKISSNIKNPFKDPDFDFKAFGQLDLEKFMSAYPIEQLSEMKGQIVMNMEGDGKLSDIEQENYKAVKMKGDFLLENAVFKGDQLPDSLKLNKLKVKLNPQKMYVDKFDGKIGKTDFNGRGWVEHYMDYYFGDGVLKGDMNASADYFDVNQFMTEAVLADSSQTEHTMSYFEVPEDMDLKLSFNAGKVIYDDLNLEAVKGELFVQDELIELDEVKGNVFSGTAVIDGTYSTKGEGMPVFDFNNQLKEIEIQPAMQKLNTFKWLAPVLEFVRGRVSTNISLNGKLGENQLPIPMTMSGDGTLRLLQGTIEQFEPLQKIAITLEVNGLKKFDVVNAITHFEFTDGRVVVQPFELEKEGVKMTIQGSHGFDQSLNYEVDAMVPKSLLNQEVNSLLSGIQKQVQQQGIDLTVPEQVPVKLNVLGTVKNPKITADYSNILGNAKDDIQAGLKDFTDSLKNEAIQIKDSLINEANEIKDSLVNKATEVKDSIQTKVQEVKENVETKVEEVKDSVQTKVQEVKEEVKEVKDSVKTEVQSKVDTIVEEQKGKVKQGLKDLLNDKNNNNNDGGNTPKESLEEKTKGKLKDLLNGKPN